MHRLLEKLMAKRGLKQETLNDEEQKTFERWNKILSNEEITTDKIREFCEAQKAIIETQWADLNNSKQKNDRLVLLHTVYSKIAKATLADRAERESLERYLNQLIDTTTV